MSKILISIIIPIYNAELYLKMCLDSIVNQGVNENIEIICINDGSNDNSQSILIGYSRNSSNFILVNQENIGLGATRNKGINLAKGKYLMFVDSDDWVIEGSLKKLIFKIKNRNDDLIEFNSEFYNLKNKTTRSFNNFDKIVSKSVNYQEYFKCQNKLLITAWSKLWNRKFVISNNLKFAEHTYFEDVQFALPAYIYSNKISNVELKVYSYRIGEKSITSSKVTNKFMRDFFNQRVVNNLKWKKTSKNVKFNKLIKKEVARAILESYYYNYKGLFSNSLSSKYLFKSIKYSSMFFIDIMDSLFNRIKDKFFV
jgi:glycosyltransferase involved in cell wall biosynthesis